MRKGAKRAIAGVIASVVIVAASFACCGKHELTENEAIDSMLKNLKEKYGKQFDVRSVEERDVGQNFSDKRFFFIIVDNEKNAVPNNEFDAAMMISGDKKTDNYAKIQFGAEIDKELWRIIKKYKGLGISDFSPQYKRTEKTWTDKDKYMKSEDFLFRCTIEPSAENTDEALREVHEWMSEMNENSYAFQVDISYDKKILSVLCDKGKKLRTLKELQKIWSETNEQQ